MYSEQNLKKKKKKGYNFSYIIHDYIIIDLNKMGIYLFIPDMGNSLVTAATVSNK